MTGGRIEARFARLFLKLSRSARAEGTRRRVHPAAAQPAGAGGSDRDDDSRRRSVIMSRWNKDSVLRTEKDGFVLVDRESLETIAAP
jgi:hypothetical protein